MRRKPKSLYWILSITSILTFIALIILIIYLYKFKDNNTLLSLFSVWVGLTSGLLFSALISLIVQIINDKINEYDLLNRSRLIRQREMNILANELSNFLSFYHINEQALLNNYGIKNSLVNNKTDIYIIKTNMEHLHKYYKRANNKNKPFIDNYLLLSDETKNRYNKLIEFLNSKLTEFKNINIDLNFEVFNENKMNSLILVPLLFDYYNDRFYTYIDNLLKVCEIFNLQIDYDNNYWSFILTLLLTDNIDLNKLKNK